jgi:hypothetical protein
MRIRLALTFFLAAMTAQTGCLAVPIPTGEQTPAGKPVSQEQVAFLTPGVTTKEEVTEHLGSPSMIWEEARLFSYDWAVRRGVLVWVAGGGYSGAGGIADISEHRSLLIQFDEHYRVRRFGSAVRPGYQSYGDFLREWVGKPDPTGPSTIEGRKE